MPMGKGMHPAYRSGKSNPKRKKNPGPDYAQPSTSGGTIIGTPTATSPTRSPLARAAGMSLLSQKPFNFGKKKGAS